MNDSESQPKVIMSKPYSQLAALGMIKPVGGTLLQLNRSSKGVDYLNATIQSSSTGQIHLDSVIGVVYATGFNAATSILCLGENVKSKLDYDPT
jgi:hypothetical protein